MKRLSLLLVFFLSPLLPSIAQESDPELADKLRSVMALFDKNQAALKNEITELKESNMGLTKANLSLYQDLQAAEKRLQSLEAENTRLREQLSQIAVRELESVALQSTQVAVASETVRPTDLTAPTSQPAPASTPSTAAESENLINVNTASQEELMTLPLIDEAMAEQIISNRPYNNLEDLIINQGFGPMKLRRISPFVTIE